MYSSYSSLAHLPWTFTGQVVSVKRRGVKKIVVIKRLWPRRGVQRNDHHTFIHCVIVCAGRLKDYFRTELSSVNLQEEERFGGGTLIAASVNNIKGSSKIMGKSEDVNSQVSEW